MTRTFTLLLDDEEHTVEVIPDGDSFVLKLEGFKHRFAPLLAKSPIYSFLIDDSEVLEAEIAFDKDYCEMNVGQVPYQLTLFDPRHRLASQGDLGGGASQGLIIAPMPGKVVDVKVSLNAKVKKGEPVVIVEAMKMQNELTSPLDGVVKEINVKAGDTVESGQKMVLIFKE